MVIVINSVIGGFDWKKFQALGRKRGDQSSPRENETGTKEN